MCGEIESDHRDQMVTFLGIMNGNAIIKDCHSSDTVWQSRAHIMIYGVAQFRSIGT